METLGPARKSTQEKRDHAVFHFADDTKDRVETVIKEILGIFGTAIYCFITMCVRLVEVAPTLILILIMAYAIIVTRFGVVWTAFIIGKAINALLYVINFCIGAAAAIGFHVHKVHPRDVVGRWIDTVLAIPKTCTRFVTWQDEILWFARLSTHNTLCPVVRYVYPIPWLYSIFDGLFGIFIIDPTPGSSTGNCMRPKGAWLCWTLGLGYFLKDFLIVFIIALQIFLAFLPLLKKFYKLVKEFLVIVHAAILKAGKKGRRGMFACFKRRQ